LRENNVTQSYTSLQMHMQDFMSIKKKCRCSSRHKILSQINGNNSGGFNAAYENYVMHIYTSLQIHTGMQKFMSIRGEIQK